jgi:hypothetical protein
MSTQLMLIFFLKSYKIPKQFQSGSQTDPKVLTESRSRPKSKCQSRWAPALVMTYMRCILLDVHRLQYFVLLCFSSEGKTRANSTLPRIERDRYSRIDHRSSSRKSRSASPSNRQQPQLQQQQPQLQQQQPHTNRRDRSTSRIPVYTNRHRSKSLQGRSDPKRQQQSRRRRTHSGAVIAWAENCSVLTGS